MNNFTPISGDIALPVLTIKAGRPVTTSLDVARVFGKRHADVLRAIQSIDLTAEFTERNFAFSEYTDPTGRNLPCYDLTRDGFTFLVMGFTGKDANLWKMRYIEAFNAMEAELLKPVKLSPDSSLEMLSIAVARMLEQERAVAKIQQEQESLKGITFEMHVEQSHQGECIKNIAQRQDDMDGDTGYMTVLAYCRRNGVAAPVEFANLFGSYAARICRHRGIRIGRVPDERWGKVNSYPIEVLRECLAAINNHAAAA